MATDWAAEQLEAYNDIKDEGTSVRVRKNSYVSYDPVADATTGATTENYDTYCIITAFKDSDDRDVHLNQSDETSVKRGDRLFLVPAYGLPDLGFAATLSEYDVLYEGNQHRILSVRTIEPGGVPILYYLNTRR